MINLAYLELDAWDPPKRAPSGSAKEDDIHLAVGRALSRWERLEVNLAGLFATFVESQSIAAVRAYGTIASARGRLDALEEASKMFFSERKDDERSAFVRIHKLCSKAAGRRNEIAHGIADALAEYGFEGGGWYQMSSDYNARKSLAFIPIDQATTDPHTWHPSKFAYTAAQIEDFSNGFHTLGQNAFNLSRRLRAYPRPATVIARSEQSHPPT